MTVPGSTTSRPRNRYGPEAPTIHIHVTGNDADCHDADWNAWRSSSLRLIAIRDTYRAVG